MLKKKFKSNNGITLVALVITIIILLILAGITISSLTNTGLFGKAQEAKEKTQNATENQAKTLNEYEDELNKYISGTVEVPKIKKVADNLGTVLSTTDNTELQDAYGNKIVVPAGFKLVSNDDTSSAQTVDKGIVIEDATVDSEGKATATAGSQFVWIPVGKIFTAVAKTEANTKTIELNRYTFDVSGNPTAQNENIVETYYQELETSNKGNTVAKSIPNFKESVETNGGYYIGRYEARKNKNGTITEVGTDTVWNNITQQNAATQAQNMYNSTKFTSDLMNSYAWDTETLFLQICGTNATYSRKNSVNNGSVASKGTNTQSTKDVQCNVYDMASNVYEWTTETSFNSNYPCIDRGGCYGNNNIFASYRKIDSTSFSDGSIGFRPILFLEPNS